MLTRYLAKELGGRGIRVNVMAPGAIESDFAGGAVRDNPELNRLVSGTIPLGRVGLPDDIGGAAAAILSDGFAWANGARIEVSGGQNLQQIRRLRPPTRRSPAAAFRIVRSWHP